MTDQPYTEYETSIATTSAALDTAVNLQINLGWRLYGAPYAFYQSTGDILHFQQAMVRFDT